MLRRRIARRSIYMIGSDYSQGNYISFSATMPIHWMRGQTPDTQINFLTVNSQISMNGDRVYSQKSMKREFADLMDRALPVGVDNRSDMSYFIVKLSAEPVDASLDREFMIMHSGLETGARDGKLWCGDDEIKIWHVAIGPHHLDVFARLANLDFIPTTAVIKQVIRRALIKFNGSDEQANFIEERKRVVPKERPREEPPEIENVEAYAPKESWNSYLRAHPSLELEGDQGVWQVRLCK